jgi:hypothetical protein
VTLTLSRPVRRLLALTILVLLVGGGWSYVVWPLLSLALEPAAEIATLKEQLSHFEAMEARAPALKRKEQVLNTSLAAKATWWTGGSGAVIGAAMQNVVRQAVAANGGRLQSSSASAERTEAGLRVISAHFNIDVPIGGLQRILEAIETAKPGLFIDRLTVSAPSWQVRSDREPSLTVDIGVTGYLGDAPA